MTALLICPSDREPVSHLSSRCPLALLPVMGQTLLEYWLTYLALNGEKSVLVLVHECADQVRRLVGNGGRWGLQVRVLPESRELTPAQVLLKYAGMDDSSGSRIVVLDHFPGCEDRPLFGSYDGFYKSAVAWMSSALTPDRVGFIEREPGVVVATSASIAPDATLKGPCWVGHNVYVGPRASIGPGTIIESGTFIDRDCEVIQSYVGPDTYVGPFAQVTSAIALGSMLLDWTSGSALQVADEFLLCGLRNTRWNFEEKGLFSRFVEAYSRNKAEVVMACKHLLMRRES